MIYAALATVPVWVWIGAAIGAIPVLLVVLAVLWEARAPRPIVQFRQDGTLFELWQSQSLPRTTDVVVVPVATDLKLIAGSALWVRGVSADLAQREADRHATMSVGDAVLVAGARYRFKRAALAVVMDDRKLYAPDGIRAALHRAAALAATLPASSITIPDWTPDLMQQPRHMTEEARRAHIGAVADAIVPAALSLAGKVPVVRLWVRDAISAAEYASKLQQVRNTRQVVAA